MDNVRIRLAEVSKVFGSGSDQEVTALLPTTADIPQGQFVALIGPSGCGKTTLLRMIGGLIRPTSGEITISGSALWDGDARNSTALSDLGIVFQEANLLPWRTVIKNVMLPLELRGTKKQSAEEVARQMLDLVGLNAFESHLPFQLSGGMRQRAAIARALSFNPQVMLMDEPFGALDAMTRDQMNLELQRIWSEAKNTIVLVTHAITEAVFLADRVIALTSRPGSVCLDLEIPFERPRSIDLTTTVEFQSYVAQIRKVIYN